MMRIFILQDRYKNRGFTLIEILIAIAILSLGVMGLYTMIIGTINGISFNKNYMTATILAQDLVERILNDDYDDVISPPYGTEQYGDLSDFENFQREATIALDNPVVDTKTITVTVSWKTASGGTRNIILGVVKSEDS